MSRRRLILAAISLAVVIAAPIAWYLISPLFITRTVNEDFPAAQAALPDSMTTSSPAASMMTATPKPIDQMPDKSAATNMSDLMNEQPDDAMMATTPESIAAGTDDAMIQKPADAMADRPAAPANEPKLLRSGEFHPVEHEGTGTASIYELPDGRRVLRLENFEVLNGPDLYVWLSSAADANDAGTILDSQYVSLGRLKGNKGNQNYELPADLDASAYNSVTIWCRQFSVNFATAPLK